MLLEHYEAGLPAARPHLTKWAQIFTDSLGFLLANWLGFWFAEGVRYAAAWPVLRAHPSMMLRLAVWGLWVFALVAWFWLVRGHYTQRRPFWDETRDVCIALLVAAVGEAALLFVIQAPFSRLWWLTTWLAALPILLLGRALLRRVLTHLGWWQRPILIFGAGENGQEAFAALKSERWLGYHVLAFVVPCVDAPEAENLGISTLMGKPVISYVLDSPARPFLARLNQPAVLIALEPQQFDIQQLLVQRFSVAGADINIAPPLKGLPLYGTELTHFFSHEVLLLRVQNNLSRRASRFIKRTFDLCVSSVLIVGLFPVWIGLFIAARRDGGPATYCAPRLGRNGVDFPCYKFRSMVLDADTCLREHLAAHPEVQPEWERFRKLKDDPRVTRFGAFARRTSLDELPQLFNVFKGDMSLVGPRPILHDEIERFGEDWAFYLMARPGITGLWQISGRNDVDFASRVALDSWYVRNWSLWYDIVILIKTVKVVLAREGAY